MSSLASPSTLTKVSRLSRCCVASRLYATEAPMPARQAPPPPLPPSQRSADAPSPSKRRRLDLESPGVLASASSFPVWSAPSRRASDSTVVNRSGAIDSELHRELQGIMQSFRAPIKHAFAYGSAVFKQKGYSDTDKPMLDFVFAVSEPVQWHALNLRQNGHHYATLARVLGSGFISAVQRGFGGKAWFNVECEVNGRLIKYGVISVKDLCDDLRDWQTLYISGRMHKPIHVLRDDPRVRLNEEINLKGAARTALLLLPESFTEEELYQRIASLSYRGDFRMSVGENPSKVANIVSAQLDRFRTLYAPYLASSSFSAVVSRSSPSSSSFSQDIAPRARGGLARKLPSGVSGPLQAHYERRYNLRAALGTEPGCELTETDEAALWTRIAKDPDFQRQLNETLEHVVAGPAFYQSLKGVISVGATKGFRYVGPKLRKRWFPAQSS